MDTERMEYIKHIITTNEVWHFDSGILLHIIEELVEEVEKVKQLEAQVNSLQDRIESLRNLRRNDKNRNKQA